MMELILRKSRLSLTEGQNDEMRIPNSRDKIAIELVNVKNLFVV